jgi:hypothetical protein
VAVELEMFPLDRARHYVQADATGHDGAAIIGGGGARGQRAAGSGVGPHMGQGRRSRDLHANCSAMSHLSPVNVAAYCPHRTEEVGAE